MAGWQKEAHLDYALSQSLGITLSAAEEEKLRAEMAEEDKEGKVVSLRGYKLIFNKAEGWSLD